MAFNNTVVARAAAAIWGVKLGYTTTQSVLAQANASGGNLDAIINAAFNDSYSTTSTAAIAKTVVANVGLTGQAATDGAAYIVAQLANVPTNARGAAISSIISLFSTLGADATYGAAATSFNAAVASAVAYSSTPGTLDSALATVPASTSFNLGLGQDSMTGTAGNDVFNAFIVNNSNTLQSADYIDGGAGNDTLFADMGGTQSFAVTPITTGVENITIRAQSRATDSGDNNVANSSLVDIDAERIVGATKFESNNSRADVIIEDVRILPAQITKDITIAFVESDPGHVDFGVYFDQLSLKNQTSSSQSITLRDLDTYNTALLGTPSLKDSNYGAFTFTYLLNGVATKVTLGTDANGVIKTGAGTIQDAQNLTQLVTALQNEVNAALPGSNVSVTLGASYTVPDPVTKTTVTGNEIVITINNSLIVIPATVDQPVTTGWLSAGTAPAVSNFYTSFSTGSTSSTSLVTSTIILDDVGRGSTSGDLVVGGLSVGNTSGSQGVQRFEIEVRDNSKMESINSTNNTLREVTIKNGATTSSSSAYTTTVQNSGILSVMGASGSNGGNVSNAGSVDAHSADTNAKNNLLPGAATQISRGYGFSDVRLIDGSAMSGQLSFTAEVTGASIGKYLNLRDIQALPAGDNIAFTYTGGSAADTIFTSIDSSAASSRNTVVAGREDFTFSANGGAGNDTITVFVGGASVAAMASANAYYPTTNGMLGGDQNWYTNQKLNKNITVNGGDGDDTIRTPGAGDKIINGGAGNDTVYADNTGNQQITATASNLAGVVYTAQSNTELAAATTARYGSLLAGSDLANAQAAEAALNTLNLVTPISFTDPAVPANPNPALPTKAALQAAIDAAATANAITLDQQIALYVAYNVATGATKTTPATLTAVALTGVTPVAGALTAAEFAAGNALLDTYISVAKAKVATETSAAANNTSWTNQLDATQQAVVAAQAAVSEPSAANEEVNVRTGGTAVVLANLNALNASLSVGATDTAVVAALQAAVTNGSISGANATAVFNAAVATPGTVDAAELTAAQNLMAVLINNANNANIAANNTLADAIAANNAAQRTAASSAGVTPTQAGAAPDSVGSAGAAAALTAATTAVNNAVGDTVTAGTLTFLQKTQSDLAALKAALTVGVADNAFQILTTNAVVNGTITAGSKTTLDNIATAVAGTLTAAEKANVDLTMTALQRTADAAVDAKQTEVSALTAIQSGLRFYSQQATSAANQATNDGTTAQYARAQFVYNTANQAAVSTAPGTGYVLAANDERNIFDLKSGASESYNLFNTSLTVTFKGLTATASVANTSYKTSDLQVNQAIKDAINNSPVLNKLLIAQDGPGNTLIVSSLIDGAMVEANLSVALSLPAVGTLAGTDISSAATAYGVSATETDVLAAMAAAKTAFDTKGDFATRFGESGAANGNTQVVGAASVTTGDNTINPGTGNNVIVLGTTVGSDALLSSNDTVVLSATWGVDTIVNFKSGTLAAGGDILDFSALGKVVSVLKPDLTVLATYGSGTADVIVVTSATGNQGVVRLGSATGTIVGTIDLADTTWASLTTANVTP